MNILFVNMILAARVQYSIHHNLVNRVSSIKIELMKNYRTYFEKIYFAAFVYLSCFQRG